MNYDAVDLLSRYCTIDTSNPPGNEKPAADFFARIFDAEGIEYKFYEPEHGRVSLRGVIRGGGGKKPLILLNHMDVVPADSRQWEHDPFSGKVADGYVHGRGALDMKGIAIMQLIAFLSMKKEGAPINRDLVYLAAADEEMMGEKGIAWLMKTYPEDFDAGLVLNEGGYGMVDMVPGKKVLMIAAAEKGLCWLRLKSEGQAGHGSIPHGANSLEKMVSALARLLSHTPAVRIVPVVLEYFKRIGSGIDAFAPFLADESPEKLAELLVSTGIIAIPQIAAMVRNTTSLDTMKAGALINVIPHEAEACIDVRILPGFSIDETISWIRTILADPEITIECVASYQATESVYEGEFREVVEEVIARHYPGTIVVPWMLLGTSDSRFFRDRGVPAFGICPAFFTLADMDTMHGVNEKISVINLEKGSRAMIDIVRGLCT